MAIICEIVGGPRDGEQVALPGCQPIRVPVLRPPVYDWLAEYDVTPRVEFRYIEMIPTLTSNGWRLYWREP